MPMERVWSRSIVAGLALIWVGMLLGVSFLATPVKFFAPSLALPVALDVGRHTFGVFSIVEAIASIALLTSVAFSKLRFRNIGLAALIGCLVAVQVFWLLPALNSRIEIILQGGTPAESGLHNLYVAIDFAKLLILGAIVWYAHSASRIRTRSRAAARAQ